MTVYRFEVEQPTYTYGYVEIEEGEDWDGRPVSNQHDARDLAYDLLADGSERIVWASSEAGDPGILNDVEVIDG